MGVWPFRFQFPVEQSSSTPYLIIMEGIQLSLSTLVPQVLGIQHLIGGPSHSHFHHQSRTNHDDGGAVTNTTLPNAATDVLVPPFDSEKRKLGHIPASLCLAATLTGPGLTVIPSLFSSCGLLHASLVLALTACLADRALYLMCLCARRGGAATLVDVGQVALGARVGIAIAALQTFFAMFVLLVELVVLTQAWAPAVQVFRKETSDWLVLLVTLLVMLPFLSRRELLSLRRSYYCWCVATALTIGTLAYLGLDQQQSQSQSQLDDGNDTEMVNKKYSSVHCMAISLSYSAMAFGCGILQILPIQGALREPTTARIQGIIRSAVLLSLAITYAFGVTGSIYGDGRLQPNVLLNITSALNNNGAAFVAAVAYGMMIFLSVQLTVMPARRALLELIDKAWIERDSHACQSCREQCPEACAECCDEDPEEQTCMTFPSLSTWSVSTPGTNWSGDVLVVHENTRLLPVITEEEIRRCNLQNNLLLHALTTVVILALSFAIAAFGASSDGIMTAWLVVGSTVVWVISYALPAICFILIQERDPTFYHRRGWTVFSWFLLIIATTASVFSVVTAVTATAMT